VELTKQELGEVKRILNSAVEKMEKMSSVLKQEGEKD